MTDGDLEAALDHVRAIFDKAPFVRDLGMTLGAVSAGAVETRLDIGERHRQHHGFVHAGVQATMADHTSGCAATTLLAAGKAVLTAEFKISLLRPAGGEALLCRARVVKPGRSISVTEADIFSIDGDREIHVSRMTATMAIVDRPA